MFLSAVVSMSTLRDDYRLYRTDGDIQQIPQIHFFCNHRFVREGVPSWVPLSAALRFYIPTPANSLTEYR